MTQATEKKWKAAQTYDLFFERGEVTEIRAIGCRGNNSAWIGFATGIVAGYFDNAEAFGQAAEALDKRKPAGIYFTINPCHPSLLARSANRLKASPSELKNLTQDREIKYLRWLLIDLDPIRFAGISSSDDELKKAESVGARIADALEGQENMVKGIRAMSGNGIHIMYRLPDWPNEEKNSDLLRGILLNLEEQFNNQNVDVDTSVFNPARIWKLYGTRARKGDAIKNRPHRPSYVYPKQPTKLADVPICQITP